MSKYAVVVTDEDRKQYASGKARRKAATERALGLAVVDVERLRTALEAIEGIDYRDGVCQAIARNALVAVDGAQ